MPFLAGLGEKIALSLALDLVKASASKVQRLLSASEAQKALQASIASALDEALDAQHLEEIDHHHYASLFERFFRREAVVDELVRILDPRPGIEPDFAILSTELADEVEVDLIPHFETDAFLRTFVSAFYAAAAREATLQGVLGIKLQGETVARLGVVAQETGRTADATEEIAQLLHQFLADRSAEPALVQAGRDANQGFLGALQAYEVITAEMNRAGYGLGVGETGAIEISGSLKVLPPMQEQIIRSLAADLRRTVLDATPGPAEIDALEERFRLHVVRWFESLQFRGLMRTPRAILLPLEEVYVELRAVAEVPDAADAFSVEERRLLLEVDEKDEPGRRELMSQLDALRRDRWSRTLPERKSIAAALHQRDRRAFVILGDPGSGKSTLLHFLALVYARGPAAAAARLAIDPLEADRLPIFAPLAAFDDMRHQNPGLSLADFLPLYYDRRRGLPGLGPLFQRALQSGRALVLLDGLDEVLDTGTRAYVAQQAGALIQEWSPRGVRFAVSSRFVGYREAALPGNLPTLSVLDFGPPEIEIFVRQWAHAYEKWAAEGVESPEMLRAAQKLAADLLTDVRSNDSVRRLAANPLMLTMLALLRRQVGRLPHRRVQLYESYIGALLETWVDARSHGDREQAITILDRHQAENLLIPLALWLQQEKPSGTAGGEELRRKLVDICLAERGLTASAPRPQVLEAEKEAGRFLREMRQLTGLLVERGHDAFGFLHLTFQEYFAGRALALLDPVRREAILRPHLHDPRWREPILLCAGRLGVTENRRTQVTGLVRAILDCPDPTEEKLHRNLLLALAIAGDDVNLETTLMTELVRQAVACLETNVYVLARRLTEALGQLVANGAVGAAECFEKVWANTDWRSRSAVVDTLGRFAGVGEIRDVLLERLDNEDSYRVGSVISALSSQIEASAEVRAAMVGRLDDGRFSGSGWVWELAAQALGRAAWIDSKIRSVLLERLEEPSPRVRNSAVRSLAGLVETDGAVREAVLRKLDDSETEVRAAAVNALVGLVDKDEATRAVVLARLEDPQEDVRASAVSALSGPAKADVPVRRVVLSKLADPDFQVQWTAIDALSSLCHLDKAVKQGILRKLSDVDLQTTAMSALTGLAVTDEEVRLALLGKLEVDNQGVQIAALRSLARLLLADPRVFSAFQEKSSGGAWQVRQSVAEALVGMGGGETQSLQILEQIFEKRDALESWDILTEVAAAAPALLARNPSWRAYWFAKLRTEQPTTRAAGLVALKDLIGFDSKVRSAALESLEDEETEARRAALSALAGVVGSDAEVRNAVLRRLDNPSLRPDVLNALAGVVGTDSEVRRIVLEMLGAQVFFVRQAALNTLAGVAETDAEVRCAVLKCLGDQNHFVRQSALSALAGAVGTDAEVRRTVMERLGDKDPEVRGSALIALAGVVESDAEVRSAVMERLLSPEQAVVRAAAVTALTILWGVSADVTSTIRDLLGDPTFKVRLAAVKVVASAPAGTVDSTLLARLQPWLATDVSRYHGDQGSERLRTQLATHFGSLAAADPNLRAWLLNQLREPRWSARCGAILALLHWPGGPPGDVLGRIFDALDDRRGLEAYPAQLTAAAFLLNRNESARESSALCLEALDYGTRPWEYLPESGEIRKQAALVLGKLEPLYFEERIYDKLLEVMEKDEYGAVRDAAYGTLVRLARFRGELMDEQIREDVDRGLRGAE